MIGSSQRIGPRLLALVLCAGAGCVPEVLPLPPPPIEDPPLDPKTLFESEAKPELVASCGGCHSMVQDTVKPFLSVGMEYESIISYEMGRFIRKPEESILVTKGPHMGPALTGAQYEKVAAWLSAEVEVRGASMSGGSPATPSVAMRPGEFFISLEKLVKDPLAKITFKMEPRPQNSYRLSELKMTAGPSSGIKVKHPVIIIFSIGGARRDESLSNVEYSMTAGQSVTMGAGTVILTNVPMTARIAMAFEIIEQVDPKPLDLFQCKNLMLFQSTVRPTLEMPCAARCHGMGAPDPRAAQAVGAFDMTQAMSPDMAQQKQFCLRTLGRVNVQMPQKSVLVLQAIPAEQGGTTNHPYKLTGDLPRQFTDAVTAWAATEQ